MDELRFELVDASTFQAIPAPRPPGARCQSCDYWERLDGHRELPADLSTSETASREAAKLARLLAGERLGGSYGMLAFRPGGASGGESDGEAPGSDAPIGWAQFGPISAYPRAQAIRDRYPALPASPPPWVITCLQLIDRHEEAASELLEAVCAALDRRGVSVVEAYPEGMGDPWLSSVGPAAAYRASGFELAAGDERYPVYRRELTGESSDEADWAKLLRSPADDEGEWPLPIPRQPSDDDLFRLPQKPRRPNPFGED